MPDARRDFQRNVAKIKADGRVASVNLVRRLKGMSAKELLNQPWTVLDQLSLEQYREVVGAIAPDVKLQVPKIEKLQSEELTWSEWWCEQSANRRSFVYVTLVTLVVSLLGILAPWAYKATLSRIPIRRPASTLTWPACHRLSAYTDGCIYTPTQDLNWARVAGQLDMPVETLRRINQQEPTPFILRGVPLAIWRERGQLEN